MVGGRTAWEGKAGGEFEMIQLSGNNQGPGWYSLLGITGLEALGKETVTKAEGT